MTVYHITTDKTGAKVSRPCRARPGECPLGGTHFDTKEGADREVERQVAEQAGSGAVATVRRTPKNAEVDGDSRGVDEEPVHYSFLSEYEQQRNEFRESNDGLPTRFYNADLLGKTMSAEAANRFANANDDIVSRAVPKGRVVAVVSRLAQCASTTADTQMDEEHTRRSAAAVGLGELTPIDQVASVIPGASHAWLGRTPTGRAVVVVDKLSPAKQFMVGHFVGGNRQTVSDQSVIFVDNRGLAGVERVHRLTGHNLLFHEEGATTPMYTKKRGVDGVWRVVRGDEQAVRARCAQSTRDVLRTVGQLEDAQMHGRAFRAQERYIKEQSSSVATVWQTKKNHDATHSALVDATPLRSEFRTVEVDDDVDVDEFHDFEDAYGEVKDKLPGFDQGKAPELRVRKLGKHSSATFHVEGLFNPVRNAIAVDVHTSGSFVHEYFHHSDLVQHSNASLTPQFQALSKEYMAKLDVPAGAKRDYYDVATEQFARMGEVYAHERLGVRNRLLDSSKFANFDYAPMMSDPQFKEKVFSFFDTLYRRTPASDDAGRG